MQLNWFSDVTDACNSGASNDHREPISLQQAVFWYMLLHVVTYLCWVSFSFYHDAEKDLSKKFFVTVRRLYEPEHEKRDLTSFLVDCEISTF